eukprot:14079797-Ditylum_brightwellii.AAC.2
MLTSIKHLKENEQYGWPRELLCRELQKGKRNREKRGNSKPPAVVPLSHPTNHNNTNQNGPNSGSKGEECPTAEHRRSKVGPMPKEISTEPKPMKERMSMDEPVNNPILPSATNLERVYKRAKP